MTPEILIPLGLMAGAVTTAVGLGGGMLLNLSLIVAGLDIESALMLSTPALLVGNLGRAFLMRRSIHFPTALTIAAAAVPGVLAGAFFLKYVDENILRALFCSSAAAYVVLAIRKEFSSRGEVEGEPIRSGPLALYGFGTGVASGSVGAGGLMLAPALRARRLERARFVATSGTVGAMVHISRIVTYGAVGLTSAPIAEAALLAVSILIGNSLGKRVLYRLSATRFRLGMLAMLTAMTLATAAKGLL
ncbi:MAG: sulfite exporter TauE/SafE family protein [Myxococcales bacterium]|nr:sulfite exporter TauE/SafE family protein [Myxococcales bacterium]